MPHIHDKIDFVVETYIVYKNTVLLRKHDKYKMWLSVGGHIELHEDPNEAAVREVKEEVGLDVILHTEEGRQPAFGDYDQSLIPPQYLERHHINDIHEHIAFIYFATTQTNVLQLSAEEITEECRWFTKEELESNRDGITDKVQFYALKALEDLSNMNY
ncbi:MAG: NUDIX domain-containing protein [bacterium]|nr:NUDIX domain-containing protein [bacterium]